MFNIDSGSDNGERPGVSPTLSGVVSVNCGYWKEKMGRMTR